MAFIYPEGYMCVDYTANRGYKVVVRALSDTGTEVALKLKDNEGNAAGRFEREIKAMLEATGPSKKPVLDYDDTFPWHAMQLALRTLAGEIESKAEWLRFNNKGDFPNAKIVVVNPFEPLL